MRNKLNQKLFLFSKFKKCASELKEPNTLPKKKIEIGPELTIPAGTRIFLAKKMVIDLHLIL